MGKLTLSFVIASQLPSGERDHLHRASVSDPLGINGRATSMVTADEDFRDRCTLAEGLCRCRERKTTGQSKEDQYDLFFHVLCFWFGFLVLVGVTDPRWPAFKKTLRRAEE